jgi:hypothetical protein
LSRLRSVSGKQAMADAADAVDRFESFSISTAVFKNPTQVSAVDLAQGLVAEEYLDLQQHHSEEADELDSKLVSTSRPITTAELEQEPASPDSPSTPVTTTYAAPIPLMTVASGGGSLVASSAGPHGARSAASYRATLQHFARSSKSM